MQSGGGYGEEKEGLGALFGSMSPQDMDDDRIIQLVL